MASFVREVLSAAGTLGEKEDFAAKTNKIQKKLNDLKSQLSVHIQNRYSNFSSTLSHTTTVNGQLERLAAEIDSLESNINKHLRAELMDRNVELLELNQGMQELNLTLQIVRKIKCCYDLMEDCNDHLSSAKWFAASASLQAVFSILRTPCSGLDQMEIKIFPSIKKEIISQKQKLSLKLKSEWGLRVVFSSKEGTHTHTLQLLGGTEQVPFKDSVEELIQALYATETLDDILHPFNQYLKINFLQPLISGTSKTDVKAGSFSVKSEQDKVDPFSVFKMLRVLFSFLATNLAVPLSKEEKSETLLERVGTKLSSWFSQTLITEVLAVAVPSSVESLPEYEAILDETVSFHAFLVDTGFLPSSDLSLVNYAKNVDALFANKLCQELLVKARDLMKEDLFTTVVITPGDSNGDPLNINPEFGDLPIPPNFAMPDKTFKFPTCSVSSSTLKVLELALKGLEEAVVAKPFCSVRLYNTVRNIFELWCAVVPTFHKSDLETLPQLSAIVHNSAMYLAHRLVTLGFLYKEKLPALSQHTPTFIDIVPRIRTVGTEVLLRCMRIQRDTIVSTLSNAGMNSAGSERRLSSGVDQAVRQFLHQLNHLQKVWQDILPADVYNRCIGTLLNSGLDEILQRILVLTDISAEVSGQYCSLLNQIVMKAPDLFLTEEPEKLVKKWGKFLELIVILNSSLRVIEDRWGEGKGVLAKEFTSEEVKQLIRAIFQNTERRAAVLSKIK